MSARRRACTKTPSCRFFFWRHCLVQSATSVCSWSKGNACAASRFQVWRLYAFYSNHCWLQHRGFSPITRCAACPFRLSPPSAVLRHSGRFSARLHSITRSLHFRRRSAWDVCWPAIGGSLRSANVKASTSRATSAFSMRLQARCSVHAARSMINICCKPVPWIKR